MNQHIAWKNCIDTLSEAIAAFYSKELNSINIRNKIVNSYDIPETVDLIIPSNNSVLANNSDIMTSTYKPLVSKLLRFPTETYIDLNSNSISLEDYLTAHSYKISSLLIDVDGGVGLGNNGGVLSSSFLLDEGYWELTYAIKDETLEYAIYYFEIDVSDVSDFSNLVVSTIDTYTSVVNWYYQQNSDAFVQMPSTGLPSDYIGNNVLYQSQISQYLNRGQQYYFRIRQKTYSSGFTYYPYAYFTQVIFT